MGKQCKRCLSEKDLSSFYKDDGNKDGLRNICIECKKTEYSLNREEKLLSGGKNYYNNRERILIYRKNKYKRESYLQKEKSSSYRKLNIDKYNAYSARRRAAKIKATPKWLNKEDLKQIELYYLAAKWIESILNVKIHVDHIIPLQGKNVCGLHVPWNLQILPKEINLKKSNKYGNIVW